MKRLLVTWFFLFMLVYKTCECQTEKTVKYSAKSGASGSSEKLETTIFLEHYLDKVSTKGRSKIWLATLKCPNAYHGTKVMKVAQENQLFLALTHPFIVKEITLRGPKAWIEKEFSIQSMFKESLNVVQVYAQCGNLICLEYVNGVDLTIIAEKWRELFFSRQSTSSQFSSSQEPWDVRAFKIMVYIFREVAKSVRLLHEKNIFYGDLKLENILVSIEGQVKLTDFGAARYMGELVKSEDGSADVTHQYMAPETISPTCLQDSYWSAYMRSDPEFGLRVKDDAIATKEADAFSFGATCVSFLSTINFKRYDLNVLENLLNKDIVNSLKEFSMDLFNTIQQSLNPNPNARLSMDAISEFFQNAKCCTEQDFKAFLSKAIGDDPLSYLM